MTRNPSRRDTYIREFASAVRSLGSGGDIGNIMSELYRLGCWHDAIEQFVREPTDHNLGECLLSLWNEQGTAIADSLRGDLVFLEALRQHVQPYSGPACVLYRGELEDRHLKRTYGIAWTSELRAAEAFASRRERSHEGRGIVLKLEATSEMIVAVPAGNLFYSQEGEYVVDTRLIREVSVVPRKSIRDTAPA
jgi:hypothetical protein